MGYLQCLKGLGCMVLQIHVGPTESTFSSLPPNQQPLLRHLGIRKVHFVGNSLGIIVGNSSGRGLIDAPLYPGF
jgi:hypothetical protein